MFGMLATVAWGRMFTDVSIAAIWSLMSVIVLFAAYKLFDWFEPKINFPEEIKKHNVAMAIVIGAFFLTVGGIIVASMLMP